MTFPSFSILRCALILGLGPAGLRAQDRSGSPLSSSSTPSTAPAADKSGDGKPTAPGKLPTVAETSSQARRAIAAMRAGQWKAARSAWEAVLTGEPDSPAALSNLGKVLFQLEDYPAAQTALEKATTLKPSLTDSWLTLGQTYLAQHAPMMAVSSMTRGVAENPADPRAHNSLAVLLKKIGWTDGAEAELQKALDLNPEYAEAHFNLAVMYLERKPPSLEMANRHYQRALQLGAEPDAVVEKQIRGESVIADEEPAERADAGVPAATSADAGEKTPSSAPPAASPGADAPAPDSGGTGAKKTSPPRQPQSSPKKSSRKS